MSALDRTKHINVVRQQLQHLHDLLESNLHWELRVSLTQTLIQVAEHLTTQERILKFEQQAASQKNA